MSSVSQGQNTSQQASQSTSQSFPIQGLPEQSILDTLGALGLQLAGNQYNQWQQQYQANSGLTQDVVNQYLGTAGVANQAATNDLQRYQDLFQPEENQLIQEANSYASPERIQSEMGRAQAGAAQTDEAGRQNAIRDLQSYGIDPSAGRYAALDNAERLQDSATQVGAANQARLATEAEGRALRSEAIQTGERYPGQITNELTTGMAGLSGGENAQLANTSVGSNILGTPQSYLQAGMQLKYPPIGQESQSSGAGASQGTQQSQATSPGGGGGSRGGGAPRSSGAPTLNIPSGGASPGLPSAGPVGGFTGNSQNPYTLNGNGNSFNPYSPFQPTGQSYNQYGFGNTPATEPGNSQFTPTFGGQSMNNLNTIGGSTQDGNFGWGSNPSTGLSQYSTPGYDTSGFGQQTSDSGFGGSSQYAGGGSSQYAARGGPIRAYDAGGSAGNSAAPGGGSSVFAPPSTTPQMPPGAAPSPSSTPAMGGDPNNPMPGPTTGGNVPWNASPSMGQQTDDIPARLNAGEFVIPRDVAQWKGHQFWQNTINKSRAEMAQQAHAAPSAKPALHGSPRFTSHQMSSRGGRMGPSASAMGGRPPHMSIGKAKPPPHAHARNPNVGR